MAIGGGVGALAAYTDYLPATRGYAKYVAKSETDSALTVASARIANLQRESAETRLLINQVRPIRCAATSSTANSNSKRPPMIRRGSCFSSGSTKSTMRFAT